MIIRVTSVAEAVLYYEGKASGLGTDLIEGYEVALLRIRRQPHAWRRIAPNTRRCLLRRFPYGILYTQDGPDLLVTAFMALRADPRRWEDRLT